MQLDEAVEALYKLFCRAPVLPYRVMQARPGGGVQIHERRYSTMTQARKGPRLPLSRQDEAILAGP